MPKSSDEIGVSDIINNQSIGPFCLGRRLSDIGNEIGPPDYWGFSPGEPLNFYVGYGPLEVYMITKENSAVINFIRLKTFKFINKAPIIKNPLATISFKVAISNTWKTPAGAKSELRRSGLNFSEEFQEPVKVETSSVVNIGSVRFYYSNDDNEEVLDSIEIS